MKKTAIESCLLAAFVVATSSCRDKDGGQRHDTSSDTMESGLVDTFDTNDSSEDSETDTDSGGEDTDTGERPNPCAEGTIHIDDDPTAYPSIQAALNAAEDGSMVYVCPGIHYETLTFHTGNPIFNDEGNTITIVGTTAEETIIDANGEGSVLTMGEATVSVMEVTLRGGSGTPYMKDGTLYTLAGGIYNQYGRLTLDHVILESNAASDAGGFLVGGTYYGSQPAMILYDCTVRNNFAEGDEDEGPYAGGAYLQMWFLMESYNTDWGEGEEDNEPEDIIYYSYSGGFFSGELNFGANASFICDSDNDGEPCQVLK